MPLSSLDQTRSPIAEALSRWRAARPADGRLPTRSAFDFGGLADRLDGAGWVAVTAVTPARFQFQVTAADRGRPLGDLEAISRHGGALRDAARPVYDDYSAAAFTGVPMLHHVTPADAPDEPPVERLILPFASDGIGVDGLLVCSIASRQPTLH